MAGPPLNLLLAIVMYFWVLSLATTTLGHPVSGNGGSGLIQGEEFLSLYIQSQQNQPSYRSDRSAAAPSAHSSYQSRQHAGRTDADAHTTKNVVQSVTSGSTIVFIDDDPLANNDTDTASVSDEIKVISVSVSSSRSTSDELQSSPTTQDGTDAPDADEMTDAADSMNEASSNFETILQPPPSTTPIETLIVHDHAYHKASGARPRSVSYSSISQTIAADEAAPSNGTQPDAQQRQQRYQRPRNKGNHQPHSSEPAKVYGEPSKIYSEPAKVYSEPERVYSEPAKVYSEPAKVYSEPAKVYSEPAKVYSEPAQNYGEPSKVYSLPAGSEGAPIRADAATPLVADTVPKPPSALIQNPASTSFYFGVHNVPPAKRIIFNLDKLPYDLLNAPVTDETQTRNYLFAPQLDGQRFHQFTRKSHGQQFGALPSPNAPVPFDAAADSAASAEQTDDRRVNATTTADRSADRPDNADGDDDDDDDAERRQLPPPEDSPDPKVGFVVEGRNYRKYRVEEKTPDGFIVGEYGVVSNNDGSLRGVRYTADSTISPNLIYETLMKFLSL